MSTFRRFDLGNFDSDQPPPKDVERSEQKPVPDYRVDDDAQVQRARVAIDAMAQQVRPPVISAKQWHVLLKDLRHLSEQWIDIALACGWSVEDLFGSPPLDQPNNRRLRGVCHYLNGRPIESIDENRIVISNERGPPNVFYRQPPGSSVATDRSAAVPIWQALDGGEA